MANELQSLSKLFQNRLFRIPDYQRGYAWQQSQLEDFWDDLINLQQDRYHYTGLLSLKSLGRKETEDWGSDLWMVNKGFKACHIVDGQQRLTTFVILLNEIICFVRKLDENKRKKNDEIVLGDDTLKDVVAKYIYQSRPPMNQITTYLFGYEVDNPSADYLRYKIFGEPYSGTVNETYYTKNLKFAKSFFRENLTALYENERIEGINNLYLKLTLNLMFNIHEIDDDYDVFVAFETMNNRGKKLTNLELLKNRLIYLTTLYSDEKFDEMEKSELRTKINDAWKEIYSQLGKNENDPLSDDDFLRAHWIIYFTYSRRKGDDYIRFLLDKFSAKNIFEKKTVRMSELPEGDVINTDYEEEDDVDNTETETIEVSKEVSKLEPNEIADYVNSLKDMAKYWYDTFFPEESNNLTDDEKIWVDRLNRIGIGYFRPLVMVIIRRDLPAAKRVEVFEVVERFLFICFRVGPFNSTFRSSEYYRAALSIHLQQMDIDDLIDKINKTINDNIEYARSSFVSKIEKHFDNMGGFYYWKSIKYFLYEYELHLAKKYNIDKVKVSREMFTKTEKDKVSIEHILPQTPTKHWRNQFRQFNDKEIELLSCAIGNLLPLSQSINSALQNDCFEDKKTSKSKGRRGYQNGSHSEIEVSKETDWTAERIYERSKRLLQFMQERWKFSFNTDQLEKLVYVSFAVDGREVPQEIEKEEPEETDAVSKRSPKAVEHISGGTELENQRIKFWTNFVDYCNQKGYGDTVALRKPSFDHWYTVPVGTADLHIDFNITRSKFLAILIYAENSDVFSRLESKKQKIEEVFGDKLDWYSSREKSNAKRILFKREADIFNPEKQYELFAWMLEKFDLLVDALISVDELDNEEPFGEKFSAIKKYLESCGKSKIALTFAEVENIIGNELCRSAYTYPAYWKPSKTHAMPNSIVAAGYEVISVDLTSKRIDLAKRN